jgi:low temperature requirement protein LtrA
MRGRDPQERHRVSTSLEALFDLVYVFAVAQAGVALEEEFAGGHAGRGVLGYVMVFFALWWAWINVTWFGSAYDTDDVPYRVGILVQIAGSLVVAAGVGRAVTGDDFTIITWGYVVMRLVGVANWLRAAAGDPPRRRTALKYAGFITVVQIGWVVRLLLPESVGFVAFFVLVVAEFSVPILAERRAVTTYHPEHIAERYGLFTVIVLGESVTSAGIAFQRAFDEDSAGPLIVLAACGVVILFALWWLYFDRPNAERLEDWRHSLRWGYGHYFIFAGAAAVGAGLNIAVLHEVPEPEAAHEVSSTLAGAEVRVPVAVYLATMVALRIGAQQDGRVRVVSSVVAVGVLAVIPAPEPAVWCAVLLAAAVVSSVVLTRKRVGREDPSKERTS